MNEARSAGRAASALRRAAWAAGAICTVVSLVVGAYTVLAPPPECGGLYVCRRVADRTLLLGWTALFVAVVTAVALAMVLRGRRFTGWPVRIVGLVLTCLLAAAYWKTHFGALRAELATQMPVTMPMWTATYAFWLAAAGLGLATIATRPR
ncbi:protein CBR-TAT-1 [Mycolicibacterium canariasense]|uniref:Protein CBR-TAT-1 n=1 Tax=Mycolicibacterium canariasense TaxID=228230 RepID=A0A100WEZ8_MYCCR|nr:hypothetical protein [Mycolicibacterium canariasense]MCV7213287.1 hypothetical protein [Mycolicibacterium canariasense]ORV05146.1 hypothetical protein AWB94_20375 [Mycolicibacterium canariasense]GAS96841.1 protein CBR-TAT-1 [Mycolicibacterium canariasense]